MTERTPISTLAIALAALLLGACSGTPDCLEPRVYQQAVAGKRIEAPEGLDSLPAEREMTIPQASPQAPPPPGECIDAPPTLRTDSDDED
ncbi:MAG: hypothetical protein U5K76_06240 [Woeseiaceae bacterium]|nr:hypothetical protein [Woeseiaceae bacterium]